MAQKIMIALIAHSDCSYKVIQSTILIYIYTSIAIRIVYTHIYIYIYIYLDVRAVMKAKT